MRFSIIILATSLITAATGCIDLDLGWEEDDWWLEPTPSAWESSGQLLQVEEAHLAGAVGPVIGLDHDASSVTGYLDPGYASIYVTVEMESAAAMTIIYVDGDIRSPNGVEVIGCSGPSAGVWDFDRGAKEVEYDVVVEEEGEEEDIVTLHYTATFSDSYGYPVTETSVVTGFVTLVVPH